MTEPRLVFPLVEADGDQVIYNHIPYRRYDTVELRARLRSVVVEMQHVPAGTIPLPVALRRAAAKMFVYGDNGLIDLAANVIHHTRYLDKHGQLDPWSRT